MGVPSLHFRARRPGPSWSVFQAYGAPVPLPDLLDRVRDARFSHGRACPHCGVSPLRKWGFFSGRQRYRCRDCGRTSSDFTGTPAAYLKKPELLVAYGHCLAHGASVRRAARRVGIHPGTAFRWRHRILDGMRSADREMLSGWVELDVERYMESRKGQRVTDRPPRRRAAGSAELLMESSIRVILASDRTGAVFGAVIRRPELTPERIEEALGPRLAGAVRVTAGPARASAWGRFARRRNGASGDPESHASPRRRTSADSLTHVRNVRAYRLRLAAWMRRFRGVATRYLPNYLVWHRTLDRGDRRGMVAEALRWPIGFG